MLLPFASAENWSLCDPHDLFLECAAKVEPGTERAFIEAQIEVFGDRAHWLEGESRCWHGAAVPVRKGEKPDRVDTSPLADFIGERAAAYRAYAQALASALALLAPAEAVRGVLPTKATLDHPQLPPRHQGETKRAR